MGKERSKCGGCKRCCGPWVWFAPVIRSGRAAHTTLCACRRPRCRPRSISPSTTRPATGTSLCASTCQGRVSPHRSCCSATASAGRARAVRSSAGTGRRAATSPSSCSIPAVTWPCGGTSPPANACATCAAPPTSENFMLRVRGRQGCPRPARALERRAGQRCCTGGWTWSMSACPAIRSAPSRRRR